MNSSSFVRRRPRLGYYSLQITMKVFQNLHLFLMEVLYVSSIVLVVQ
jgi:hypothetical protein